mmetsp:Transcript_51543/g.117836  ORF Transcript_51543/g.117836 Transcript_51543/m.117836 type:complete len:260 (-) Transcript_51543:336-1115(-)
MVVVGVLLERLGEHDGIHGRGAPHREGVAHDGPLLQGPVPGEPRQRHDLPEVVQQSHQVEPVVVRPLGTDALRRLEVVDAVRKVHVGIRIVDEVVEHLDDFHHGELSLLEPQPAVTLLSPEVHRLLGVHRVVRPCHLLLPAGVLVVTERVPEHILAIVRAVVLQAGARVAGAARVRLGAFLALEKQPIQVLQVDRAAELPRQLGGDRGAHDARVARHRLLLKAVVLAVDPCTHHRDELIELGGVRLLVALRKAPLRTGH